MTKVQKIIKYFALALSIFIIVNLISGVFYGISRVLGFHINNNSNIQNNIKEYDSIEEIEMDIKTVSLTIKEGDIFKVETSDKYISTKKDKNKLYIEEKRHSWFSKYDKLDVIVYVPINKVYDIIDIEAGAGNINVETLNVKILSLEVGAGTLSVDELNVLDDAKIEGGAGKINVSSGTIKNLDLDMGVGKITLNNKIIGNSKIDSGIGSLDVNLIGDKNDYKIKSSKGLGSINIDGKDISDNEITGDGKNNLIINGGIGSIKINFNNIQ